MAPRRDTGVLAAALVAAGTTVVAPVPPAHASGLCSGKGVHVVVDFEELGGGAQEGCDPRGAGDPASAVFPAAGFPLTYVQSDPGFVCRVAGKPASDPCARTPPAHAHWSLWWSDGTSGTWTYANQGVSSLSVGDGGFLGFAWHGGGERTPPGIAPVAPASEPAASPKPKPKPTVDPPRESPARPTSQPEPQSDHQSDHQSGTQSDHRSAGQPTQRSHEQRELHSGPPPTSTPSTDPSTDPERSATGRPAPVIVPEQPSPFPSPFPAPGADPDAEATEPVRAAGSTLDRDLPAWLPVGLVAVLLAAAAGVHRLRRRSGDRSDRQGGVSAGASGGGGPG